MVGPAGLNYCFCFNGTSIFQWYCSLERSLSLSPNSRIPEFQTISRLGPCPQGFHRYLSKPPIFISSLLTRASIHYHLHCSNSSPPFVILRAPCTSPLLQRISTLITSTFINTTQPVLVTQNQKQYPIHASPLCPLAPCSTATVK